MAIFTDVFEDVTKQGTKIPTNLYLDSGMYPIIDQGQSEIAGYTNETQGLFTDVPAIIFGDHTRIIKYVETPCFLGADGVKLLKAKDPHANYKYLYYALCHADIPNTGYNRHFKWLKEVNIREYTEEEQKHIVTQLEKVDYLILLRKQQLSKLDELVKARFVELFGSVHDERFELKSLPEIVIKDKNSIKRGPFGGALKNISIGLASSNGKRYIHCNGKENASYEDMFQSDHDSFIKGMADAAKTITETYKNKIAFINSVVNLSVDCDCCGTAKDPCMKDIGILASLDPVALDQACIDLVYNSTDQGKEALIERIESRHGLLILESAEKQQIGTREYELISID